MLLVLTFYAHSRVAHLPRGGGLLAVTYAETSMEPSSNSFTIRISAGTQRSNAWAAGPMTC